MRNLAKQIRRAALIAAFLPFVIARPASAFGLSPPTVLVDEVLSDGDSVTESVTIQRGEGEVGALVFSAGFHGECDGCVQGPGTVVMGPGQDAVAYEFSVAPGAVASGEYRQYVAFLIEEVLDGPSGNAVQRGVTATVRFTVDNDVSGGGGCGACGSGGGGGTDPDPEPTGGPSEEPDEEPPQDTGTGPSGEPEAVPEEETEEGVETPPVDVPVTMEPTEEFEPVPIVTVPSVGGNSASSTEDACPADDAVTDRDGDGTVSRDDAFLLMRSHLASSCVDGTCDLNADCLFDLADVSTIASRTGEGPARDEVPPVQSGNPLGSDEVNFYFEEGSQKGSYRFVLASAPGGPEDLVTFYLLVDTGENGVTASDVTFRYDTGAVRLVGADTVGSVFPFVRGVYGTGGEGTVRVVGASGIPFVGTRGYVASFQFQPLKDGDLEIAFLSADAVGRNASVPISVGTTDLRGLLESLPRASAEAAASTGPVSSGPYVCPCLRERYFPICLLLACAFLTSAFGLLILWKIRRAARREAAATQTI